MSSGRATRRKSSALLHTVSGWDSDQGIAPDHFKAGGITRRVTDTQNAVDVSTVAIWPAATGMDRRAGLAWLRLA